jgi:Spy/CpxP family protein refolding chaperone
MKKSTTICFLAALLFFTGCATSNSSYTSDRDDNYRSEETLAKSKLNNRRLEKNLDKFSAELSLTAKQQKQLRKIDRRYARMERKLSRRSDTRRRDKNRLAEEKRLEILEVLTPRQQEKLEALMKKGRFSFEQWFGK